jgi:plasmid maintenance system antidote protein VapI
MIVMGKKSKHPASLSEQLKAAILNCGQTRYRIAQETGITEATLSKFVHGHHGLSQETVDVLGEYLGLRLVVRPKPRDSNSKVVAAKKPAAK